MAANNAREKILATLKTKLEGITVAAGYQNDIGRVFRGYVNWEKIAPNEFPALFILDDGNETIINFNTDDASLWSEAHIKLVGYVKNNGSDTEALSTQFNAFKADLDKMMWSFNALNNKSAGTMDTNAADIRITAYEHISTWPEGVIFQADVKFDYWFFKANP